MISFLRWTFVVALIAIAVPVGAANTAVADSQRIDKAALALERQIIAPCCWHQAVADHNSPAATEIRHAIRASLREGKTPEAITAAYVAQYGERILAVPPRRGFNYTLWAIPFIATIGAFWLASHLLRRWRHEEAKPATAAVPTPAGASAYAKVDEQLRRWEE